MHEETIKLLNNEELGYLTFASLDNLSYSNLDETNQKYHVYSVAE